MRETFAIQRHSAMPLETRGLLASYDRARRMLEVHGPTKVPHTNRGCWPACCGWEADIRFIEPDVGGSFGARGEFYPEDFLVPWVSIRLNRPIRWIEDRFEHFSAINHSREVTFEVTAAADAGGIITAFDVRLVADLGAYIRTHGDVVPSHRPRPFRGRIACATTAPMRSPRSATRRRAARCARPACSRRISRASAPSISSLISSASTAPKSAGAI